MHNKKKLATFETLDFCFFFWKTISSKKKKNLEDQKKVSETVAMPPKRKAERSPSPAKKKAKNNEEETRGRSKSPKRNNTDFERSASRSSSLDVEKEGKKVKATKTRSKSPSKQRVKSPIRSGIDIKVKREGIKRISTIDETTQEAISFLKQSGSKNLLTTSATLPETRGRTRARNTLSEILGESVALLFHPFPTYSVLTHILSILQ